ncbi:MAG: cupin domain-containing protein [Woeseia sp.]
MSDVRDRICVYCMLLGAFGAAWAEEIPEVRTYEIASAGTRQFEWDSETGPGWIKILVEASNLGSDGVEVGEIFFPPGWEGKSHYHQLEIFYVIEGELEHIVNGESRVLEPGMIGMVRYPDEVVHKTHSRDGVRVLVIWPLGNEVKGLQGMTESPVERVR